MPDWQVGYPPTPTLADRGDGRTRVTYAPWELDSWFFDQITTAGACYLQNCTLAQVSQIVGKGGTERTGYWFDCQVAFGVWAAGNRIAPQRSAAVNWQTTMAAALAAAATLDSCLIWYSATTLNRQWTTFINAGTVKGIDIFFMLARRKLVVVMANNTNFYSFSGVLNPIVRQIIIRNATMYARTGGGTTQFVNWNDTGGAGAGVILESCALVGGVGINILAGAARVCVLRNVAMHYTAALAPAAGMTAISYNNTLMGGGHGNLLNLASWVSNVMVMSPLAAACYQNMAGAVFQTSGSSDATGTPAGLQNLVVAQLAPWCLNGYGNFIQKDLARVLNTSILVGAGTPIASVPADMDNNPRSLTAPTVGAHEGTQKPWQNYVPPRPQNFAITNLGTDSDLLFTWSNGADYAALDDMVIFTAAGVELGRTAAGVGQVQIGGLTNQAVYSNVYARAISDNGVLGPASALQTNTPTQRILGRTTIHLTCDAADDDSEDIYRYYWFIGTSLAATQALRVAVQAMIDARLPLTGFAAVTDVPDLEQAGYLIDPAIDYWGFVVAMDEDGTYTPTAPADIVHIIPNPGSGTLTANTHIRVMEAVGPALYPIM